MRLLIMAVVFMTVCFSQTPIGFQGILFDEVGDSLVGDGEYSMTFSMFSAESGGSVLWSEVKNVAVEKGVYSVGLGEVNDLQNVDFSNQLWLGITFQSQVLPRVKLTSTPHSYRSLQANNSEALGGISANGFQQKLPYSHATIESMTVGTEWQSIISTPITVDRDSDLSCTGFIKDNDTGVWSSIQILLYSTDGQVLDYGTSSWRNPPAIMNGVYSTITYSVSAGSYVIALEGSAAEEATWGSISLSVIGYDQITNQRQDQPTPTFRPTANPRMPIDIDNN